jgi:FixJ family two-component response regulator
MDPDVHVFLIDDDPAVRRTLTRMLGEAGWHVDAFESAEAFLARADPGRHGCLVLDVELPGLDGIALQGELARQGQAWPIVFLTGHGDIPMTVQAMKSGAVDFLTKPVHVAALLGAVSAALAREATARHEQEALAQMQRRLAGLTDRDREVLMGIVRGQLNKQIAYDLGIVEQTVKYHRARIMERMAVGSLAELIQVTTRLGLGPDAPEAQRKV